MTVGSNLLLCEATEVGDSGIPTANLAWPLEDSWDSRFLLSSSLLNMRGRKDSWPLSTRVPETLWPLLIVTVLTFPGISSQGKERHLRRLNDVLMTAES